MLLQKISRFFPKSYSVGCVCLQSVLNNSTFVGIDLGTTNSCVAHFEGGRPEVIPNSLGSRTTPSVVAFTGDKNTSVLVGVPAKRQAVANSKNTIFGVKRLIGRRYHDADIQLDLRRLPFDIEEAENGEIQLCVGGNKHSPSEISAYILREMKLVAENHLGSTVKDAVITVPAYFNDGQRQATREAGERAGLTVHRIINEPTAAALAYGIDKSEDKIIAVYDLGGGTFDVSLLEIQKGVFEVRSTNGDTLLGGGDFDDLLSDHIIDKIGDTSVRNEASTLQRIKEAAEAAKIALSVDLSTTINLPFISTDKSGRPLHFKMDLSRSDYEAIVSGLVKRTIPPCKQALSDANIAESEVNEVILVGGMTRMPIIKETVKQIFGRNPTDGVNPDEAVALGAAIQAGVLVGEVEDILLLDVIPLSLGIETLGGAVARLLPRNTSIPAKVTQVFSTAVDGQTQVEINIYQGERELAHDNKLLGQFVLVDIPPQPRGVPRIEVTFDIDVDGILSVSARDQATGKAQRLLVNPVSGLSREEVRSSLKAAARHSADDRRRRAVIESAMALRVLAEDVCQKIAEFGTQLPEEEATALTEFCQHSVLGCMEELKSRQALEEIQQLNADLQEKALDLFRKARRETSDGSKDTK
uniref:Heat shock protein 70 n=1 Tax=Mesocestoides corti TaxID=53468 RepID=A0A5K3F8H5_MESCO